MEHEVSILDELNDTSEPIEIGIHSIDFFPSNLTASPDVYASIEFDPDNPDPSFDRDNPIKGTHTIFSKSRIQESDAVNVNGTRENERVNVSGTRTPDLREIDTPTRENHTEIHTVHPISCTLEREYVHL